MGATLTYMTTTELIPVSHLVRWHRILMDGDTVKGTVILVDGEHRPLRQRHAVRRHAS